MDSPKLWQKKLNKGIKGFVSVEDLKDAFIVPQTKVTGMGVALSMQEKNGAKKAKVMVSHCWREDVEQVLQILEKAKGTRLEGGGTFQDDTVIWFCAFSQYQAGDKNTRPTIQQQLDLEPFKQVIENKDVKDMFVIQTLAADPYSRMWCTAELGYALKRNTKFGETNIKIHPFFSKEWLKNYVYYEDVEEQHECKWVGDTFVRQQGDENALGQREMSM